MIDYINANDDCITKVQSTFNARALYYDSPSLFPSGYLDILKKSYSSREAAMPKYCGFTATQNNIVPLSFDFKAMKSNSFIDFARMNFTPSYEVKDFNDLYPIAVRYTDNKNIWLIERPPFKATVTFKNNSSNQPSKKDYIFDIWVPWTLMLLHVIPEESYYNGYLYFNDGPLTSSKDSFIPCIYPNMYVDGRMCLNETSLLLQQHLSSTESFDISTIYNFIINDYMSGGWNVDLGVGYFQTQAPRLVKEDDSTFASSTYKAITYGDKSNKIPSSVTAYGRISHKRYTLNFLKYFSSLSLQEVTSIITDFKRSNEVRTHNLENLFETTLVNNSTSFAHFSKILFPEDFRSASYIDTNYVGLIDYDYLNFLNSDTPEANYKLKQIIIKIHDLLYSDNSKSVNKLIKTNSEESILYSDFRNYKENGFIIITDDSVEIVGRYLDSDYYFSKFPKLSLDSANV